MRLNLILFACCAFAQHSMLPDPKLTPGAINPAVTQENIRETICVAGWTKTVRPPASFTDKLKAQQMKERGIKGKPSDFEEDHMLDIGAGGAPRDPHNLYPQPWPEARLKDRVEVSVQRRICAGKLTLKEGQAIMLGDWTVEYQKITGETVAQALARKAKE